MNRIKTAACLMLAMGTLAGCSHSQGSSSAPAGGSGMVTTAPQPPGSKEDQIIKQRQQQAAQSANAGHPAAPGSH